jgi:hypothetical protein
MIPCNPNPITTSRAFGPPVQRTGATRLTRHVLELQRDLIAIGGETDRLVNHDVAGGGEGLADSAIFEVAREQTVLNLIQHVDPASQFHEFFGIHCPGDFA